jgi:hypothetical protein
MPFTLDQVHEVAISWPDVTVGPKWGMRTWMVGGKGFIWERPLRKSDLERLGDEPAPKGDILGVRTENLDAKDALLAMDLPGFFTIQHFNGYPAVLIALRQARAKDVRAAIEGAYRAVASKQRKPRATGGTKRDGARRASRARSAPARRRDR